MICEVTGLLPVFVASNDGIKVEPVEAESPIALEVEDHAYVI